MPRRLRVEYAGAIYHEMSWGSLGGNFLGCRGLAFFLAERGSPKGAVGGAIAKGNNDELGMDSAVFGDGPLAHRRQRHSTQ